MMATTRLLPSQRNSSNNNGTAAATSGYESSSSRTSRTQRQQRSSNKKRNNSAAGNSAESNSGSGAGAGGGGSLLWTCCFFGLVATVVNLAYIAQTVLGHRHDHLLLEKQHHASSSSSTTTTKTTTTANNKKHVVKDDNGDKGPILDLIREAGFTDLDEETLARVPSWSQVASLYGPEPVFFGLDDGVCERFQSTGDRAEHFIGTAGTFNTGTNLLSELLIANCHMPERQAKYGKVSRGVRWQVQWGKHTPVFNETFRREHQTYKDNEKDKGKTTTPNTLTADNMFPAVTVRDPYKWMQSMCRHAYAAKWNHATEHCPSLVPNAADLREFPHLDGHDTIPVHVRYAEFTTHHDSMVGFWNDWYNDYIKKAKDKVFPFLLVRFEDVVYHPKNVTQTICECAGGQMDQHHKFRYIVDSAKRGDAAHGDKKTRTSYLDALIKYGTRQGRYKGYEQADLAYVKQHLDPNLMQLLGYPFHDDDGDDTTNAAAAAVSTR